MRAKMRRAILSGVSVSVGGLVAIAVLILALTFIGKSVPPNLPIRLYRQTQGGEPICPNCGGTIKSLTIAMG